MLVGRNGSGKSSVVEAIALLWGDAICTRLARQPLFQIFDTDVRQGASALSLEMELTSGQRASVSWSRRTDVHDHRIQLSSHWTQSPVLKCLWADRPTRNVGWREDGDFEVEDDLPEPWTNAFESGYEALIGVIPWFRREENLENEVRLNRDASYRRPTLEAVRRALKTFLGAVMDAPISRPRISRVDPHGDPLAPATDGTLVVDKAGTPLTIDQLSDGERFIVLLVCDLALRLAVASKEPGDPLGREGIVVIDEVEQHLHPGWQATLLPALHQTFPGLQFIVTTHSPLVVSSVPGAAVRVLDGFQAYDTIPTLGRDSNSLLEAVFGVSPRPAGFQQRLDEVGALIDEGDLTSAKQRLGQLGAELTDQDPEVVRLRTLLRFLEG